MYGKLIFGLLVILVIITSVGFPLLNYQLKLNFAKLESQASPSQVSDPNLGKQLEEIKAELVRIRSGQDSSAVVLGQGTTSTIDDIVNQFEATPSAKNLKITITSSSRKTLNIYKDKFFTSSVVGLLDFGKNYPVLKKEPPWYLVELGSGMTGWVNAQYVSEL